MNKREYLEMEPLYPQAVEFTKVNSTMSITRLQRNFRIGYNRAQRLIEQLCADGYLKRNNITGAYRRPSTIKIII